MSAERATNRPDRSKATRVPLGNRARLSFNNLEEGYVYRVINDVDDRIKRAEAAGYEFVESESSLGDARVADASKMGAKVSKPVGGGMTGYLMRIKKDWYDEDQQNKQKQIDSTESAMKPDNKQNQYGEGLTNS